MIRARIDDFAFVSFTTRLTMACAIELGMGAAGSFFNSMQMSATMKANWETV